MLITSSRKGTQCPKKIFSHLEILSKCAINQISPSWSAQPWQIAYARVSPFRLHPHKVKKITPELINASTLWHLQSRTQPQP